MLDCCAALPAESRVEGFGGLVESFLDVPFRVREGDAALLDRQREMIDAALDEFDPVTAVEIEIVMRRQIVVVARQIGRASCRERVSPYV